MNWGVAGPIIGSVLGAVALLGSGWFAARATRAAAKLTAEAQQAAAEPAQRAADLATFREIREGLDRRLERSERRIDSLTTLVRAYAWYVADLTGLMRRHGIEPPEPPERVKEYDRTGV